MGNAILKGTPDLDMYCEWSTVVDGPTSVGTRAEMLARGVSPERLDRADKRGASWLDSDTYQTFDSHGLLVLNGGDSHAFLPRELLGDYLTILHALLPDESAAIAAADRLLDPLDCCPECQEDDE